MQFMAPVIQLVNLTAETTYCYSISVTETAIDTTVVGSCDGTFITAAEATPSPTIPGRCVHSLTGKDKVYQFGLFAWMAIDVSSTIA